jgi:hypothetical protein
MTGDELKGEYPSTFSQPIIGFDFSEGRMQHMRMNFPKKAKK